MFYDSVEEGQATYSLTDFLVLPVHEFSNEQLET
jgi:hypothetical protein